MGQIEGNQPKQHKSPSTKRFTNIVSDIDGAKAKDHRSIPPEKKHQLQESVYEPMPKNGRRMPPIPRPNMPVYEKGGASAMMSPGKRDNMRLLDSYQPPKTEMQSIMKPDYSTIDAAKDKLDRQPYQ